MKNILRKLIPQKIINIFYHLPKAILANLVYGFPARGLKVIGVTGTDGKTTTVNMICQIIKAAGKKVSMVSTINSPGLHVTSPDPFTIQKLAGEAKQHGDEYLVLEVTSHALDQYRFWGIKFDIGVITTITHEHLDYHKTFENYSNTKLRLIRNSKYAVINHNLSQTIGRPSHVMLSDNVVTFGLDKGDFNQKDLKLKLKVPGKYNIENALCSLAVASVLGIDRKIAQKTLENFEGLTGRMEEIKNKKGIKIFIDFAHTPNGLEQALRTLRSHIGSGKLIAVFGSAGKRDVGKRQKMGEIASSLADYVVLTAEDPRGEIESINKQIMAGVKDKKKIICYK